MESWLAAYRSGARRPDAELAETLRMSDASDFASLLEWIVETPPEGHEQRRFAASTLDILFERVRRPGNAASFEILLPALAELYRRTRGDEDAYRYLQLMAQIGTDASLTMFTEFLVARPPEDSAHVAAACSPLLQGDRRTDLPKVFPRLLDGLAHLSAGAIILDLANFTVRERLVREHPASARREHLAAMLGDLAQRLESLDEQGWTEGSLASARRKQVGESVALAVTLCDALGLLGDRAFIGKLYPALELRHRRIRAEAAFALARLGERVGEDVVVEMASVPATRLRALAYAEELGVEGRVAEPFTTDVAKAESELAMWLSEPTRMGIPPTDLTLVDRRELYWPGYSEPVDCCLFRFTYALPRGEFSNIGITGPMTHASSADLTELEADDIYALFAGRQAEHNDIFEFDLASLTESATRDARRLEQRVRSDGYADVVPVTLGSFFGERALVARARLDRAEGLVVADHDAIEWWPRGEGGHPLGADDVFAIYKGRRLLNAFNA
ncbi:MAG: HEAT repeat domain-containing protein [Planctomycetes bacterium]|nr:HEAT repeat domain-containing protein [Planctomycetota bacterium]